MPSLHSQSAVAASFGNSASFKMAGGLLEGIRRYRERSKAEDALSSAIQNNDQKLFQSAISAFDSLESRHKLKIFSDMEKELTHLSGFPFEKEAKVSKITMLADFFAHASKALPKDERGEIDPKSCKTSVRFLAKILNENSFFRSDDPLHQRCACACANALFELDYGNRDFWQDRLLDQSTQALTIKKLLEMSPDAEGANHGWDLLKENLVKLALAIAKNDSQTKVSFFKAMLCEKDADILRPVVATLSHSQRVPPEFIDGAYHLSSFSFQDRILAVNALLPRYDGQNSRVRYMLNQIGAKLAQELSAPGNTRDHLEGLEALSHLSSGGITPYSGKTLAKILSRFMHSLDAHEQFHPLLFSIIGRSKDPELLSEAERMRAMRIKFLEKCLEYADERQFDASFELISLYNSGLRYLEPMLKAVGTDMKDILEENYGDDEKQHETEKALSVMVHLAQCGIQVDGISFVFQGQEQSIEAGDAPLKMSRKMAKVDAHE